MGRAVVTRARGVGAFLAAVAVILVAPRAAPAHERHQGSTEARAPEAAAREPTATEHGDSVAAQDHEAHGKEPEPRPYAMPPMGEALVHHLHNKLVHVPVALAPVAVILLLLDRRRPGLAAAGAVLVWIAAAGAAASYFAGRAQEEAFHGDPKQWLAGAHETWGTVAAITLVAWALLTLWPPARRHLWLWGLVSSVAVLGAAFLGGLVAHG